MAKMARCECGKAMGKNAVRCRACEAARSAARFAEAAAIVATGKCPRCSLPLRRNLALTGWWQCAAYGEPSMRAAEFRTAAPCSFQTFTAD